MTFAPPTIKEVRALLKGEDADLDDNELGIVGGPSHVATGTSYHLGEDQLIMSKNPYSARTARDLAGLSNAASALDVDDDLDELRELSTWIVEECRAGAPDTLDIREVIYSPDGVAVLRWDRERGVGSAPVPDSDTSHRTHTHFSWYRDSEFRDKTAVFRRFFEGDDMTPEQNRLLRNAETYAWKKSAGEDPITGILDNSGNLIEPGMPNVPLQVAKQTRAAAQEAVKLTSELLARPPVAAAPIDPEALKLALLDPEVLAAFAQAVSDEIHVRMKSR